MERPAQRYFCNKCGYVGNVDLHSGCGYLAYHLAPFEQNYIDQLEAEIAKLRASPASALEGFKHDIGADRFTVVHGSYWWHVRAGEGTQNIGKFHTKRAAEEMALTLLTAFRDGAFMQYQAMLAAAPTPPSTDDRKDAELQDAGMQLQKQNEKLKARCAELEKANAYWRNGGYTSLWKLRTEDRDKTIESQRLTLLDLRGKLAAKQARIDELMLEYCPDETTTGQLEEYEKHQVPVSEDQKDAERYRWLVSNSFDRYGVTQAHIHIHTFKPDTFTGELTEWSQRIMGGAIDTFIDKAMQEDKKP